MTIHHRIQQTLTSAFHPTHLEVINESNQHNVPAGSQSHFKVILVADQFAGLSPVKRHQQVYKVLTAELTQIHALALHVYTVAEWQQRMEAPASPHCRGGMKGETKDTQT
ncbi:MAG: BolA/IbaG family iron-sulfur metabolism protein [Legionellales bacterium]|nr:BolA/IbaG family iron-sulfur metabolism protein [Legionellales bacterium]